MRPFEGLTCSTRDKSAHALQVFLGIHGQDATVAQQYAITECQPGVLCRDGGVGIVHQPDHAIDLRAGLQSFPSQRLDTDP